MNKYRQINNDRGQRSVDGFIPSVPRLIRDEKTDKKPLTPAQEPSSIDKPGGVDGFSPMPQQIDKLPSLQPYSPVSHITQPEAKPKKKRNYRKIFKRASIGLSAAVFLFGGYFIFKIIWNANKVLKGDASTALAFNSEIDPTLLNGEGDGRVNILLLGKGGPNHPGGDLTDSLLIASIDPLAKEASLLSLPRDLWVKVPDYWSMKINNVYTTGKQQAFAVNDADEAAAEKAGISLVEDVIERDIGIPIHYYVMVNFDAFQQAVDAVGGIDVTVKEPLYDYLQAWDNNNDPLIADAGLQHFNGKTALLYTRSRSSSSDFARGERQREVTIGLKEKVMQLGTFSNPLTVSKLIDAVGSNVTTNLSMNEIMRLYEIGKDIPTTSIASLGLTDPPNVLVKTANISEQSVVIPRRGQNDFSEIQSFVRNSLRDGFLKSENASVVVLNGSGISGLASKRADELRSFGYNVTIVDDAPRTDYVSTELVDFTKGVKKYTKRYLEQRLNLTAVTSSAGIDNTLYNADFVIIVGSNENTTSSTD